MLKEAKEVNNWKKSTHCLFELIKSDDNKMQFQFSYISKRNTERWVKKQKTEP